jgi:hypothetical protein
MEVASWVAGAAAVTTGLLIGLSMGTWLGLSRCWWRCSSAGGFASVRRPPASLDHLVIGSTGSG